jgi:hypothetical protein
MELKYFAPAPPGNGAIKVKPKPQAHTTSDMTRNPDAHMETALG